MSETIIIFAPGNARSSFECVNESVEDVSTRLGNWVAGKPWPTFRNGEVAVNPLAVLYVKAVNQGAING